MGSGRNRSTFRAEYLAVNLDPRRKMLIPTQHSALSGDDMEPTVKKQRYLSGVQPSGKLHLGNYFGAIKQHIELQAEGDCFYFIADSHPLPTPPNPPPPRT